MRVLAWAAALAVVLVLGFVAALFVERWGNLRRERAERKRIDALNAAERERRARAFAALVVGHERQVIEFPLRGGKS